MHIKKLHLSQPEFPSKALPPCVATRAQLREDYCHIRFRAIQQAIIWRSESCPESPS